MNFRTICSHPIIQFFHFFLTIQIYMVTDKGWEFRELYVIYLVHFLAFRVPCRSKLSFSVLNHLKIFWLVKLLGNSSELVTRNSLEWVKRNSFELDSRNSLELNLINSRETISSTDCPCPGFIPGISQKRTFLRKFSRISPISVNIFTGFSSERLLEIPAESKERFLEMSMDFLQNCYLGFNMSNSSKNTERFLFILFLF